MSVSREQVVSVIKELAEARSVRGTALDDPERLRAVLAAACRRAGISLEDYANALRESPALADLEKEALLRAVTDVPDPGPYDCISRESPSGQPGDLTKSRTPPRQG